MELTDEERAILPQPTSPPDRIYEDSTNTEVQLFIYFRLRHVYDQENAKALWEKVSKFRGTGHYVLRFKEETWVEQLGIDGRMIYGDIEALKYVHTDTIWPWLQAFQIAFFPVAGIIFGLDLTKKNDLQRTGAIGIAFIAYTFFMRLFYTFASSRWFERNPRIPTFLKCRPPTPGQSPWIPSFGASPQ